jgi:hypothetical protein
MDRRNGGGAIFSTALTSTSKSSGFDPQKATLSSLAQINIAIDVLTVDISRPAEIEPFGPAAMRSISSAGRVGRGARSGKLSASERSALNQALAKALAFRDAGKMPEAREWAAELVRLFKSHDLRT